MFAAILFEQYINLSKYLSESDVIFALAFPQCKGTLRTTLSCLGNGREMQMTLEWENIWSLNKHTLVILIAQFIPLKILGTDDVTKSFAPV